MPPLKIDDAVEGVPKPVQKAGSDVSEDSRASRLGFMTKPITEGILTLAFISAVFVGFLLSSALYSSVRAQDFVFNENTFILSPGFRVYEASVIKVRDALGGAIYDYLYGFLP